MLEQQLDRSQSRFRHAYDENRSARDFGNLDLGLAGIWDLGLAGIWDLGFGIWHYVTRPLVKHSATSAVAWQAMHFVAGLRSIPRPSHNRDEAQPRFPFAVRPTI